MIRVFRTHHAGTPARLAGLASLAALLLLMTGSPEAAESAAAKPRGSAAEAAAPSSATVDVNSASVEELMSVKGIGASLAQRIVEFREKNGPYRTIEDLLKVQGIGEKSLEKLRDHLTIGKGRGR